MRHLSCLVFLAAGILLGSISWAQSYEEGAKAALSQQNSTINELIQLEVGQRTQIALNALVQAGNEALAENGYAAEAAEYQKEWNAHFAGYFMAFQIFDLGDHQPLNAWLADYYRKLEDRLGRPILHLLHLDDINILNYAIPVVFQPNGDRRNGDHWDEAEYGRHFVPFSGVIVYWSSYIGCRVATRSYVKFKKYCGVAAATLEHLTTSTIAPKLSDHVYVAMTKKKNDHFMVDFGRFNPVAQQQLEQIPQD